MSSVSLQSFATYDQRGSSARVRLYDWFDHLGLTPTLHTYLGASTNSPVALAKRPLDVLRAERALRTAAAHVSTDHVLIGREATPLGRGAIEGKLLARAAHGVYDFDDALYRGYPGSPLLSALSGREHVWRLAVQNADVVIAGSDILAEQAQRFSESVVMIPSCVRHDLYRVKTDFTAGEIPRAVWLGSPSTEPYLAEIESALLAAHRETGLRLTVISAGERSLNGLDIMVDRVAWTPENYLSILPDADFGIMPLPDDEWTRGKCAYKLLQYAASGLPVIGSGVGANVTALTQLGGIIATDTASWTDALIGLVQTTAADRGTHGAQARTGVIAGYSFDAWADTWHQNVMGTTR